jgi:hypothetical protein
MRYLCIPISLFIFISYCFSQNTDIPAQIDKAKSLYSQGKYSESINELNVAISQIQNLLMDKYKTVFPAALNGWDADEFETSAAGMAFMGGGISVSRNYNTNDGATYVKIEMVSDSPLLSSIMMMFSNPMFLGGKKIVNLGSEKAIEEWNGEDQSGTLQIVIDNKVLFTVNGNDIANKDIMYSYANKIDFAKLRTFIK